MAIHTRSEAAKLRQPWSLRPTMSHHSHLRITFNQRRMIRNVEGLTPLHNPEVDAIDSIHTQRHTLRRIGSSLTQYYTLP